MTHLLAKTRKSSWPISLLLQRCPRCRQGRIFDGLFSMLHYCPVCGLNFRGEEGFWLGAMYCSYGLAVLFVVPLFFLFQWLLPSWPGVAIAAAAVLPYIPLTPFVFRYSRVIWIYFEHFIDPHALTARED